MILTFGYIFIELGLHVAQIDTSGKIAEAAHTTVSPSGRALNQAIAAARMGAKVSLIGAVGEDLFGKDILHRLQREGITSTGVLRAKGSTGIITRILSADGETINIMTPGVNVQTKSLQIPLMSMQYKALMLLQDDVPVIENAALLKRAKLGGSLTVMNAHSTLQFSETLAYVDFLIVGQDLVIPDDYKGHIIRFIPSSMDADFDAFFAEDCFCGAFAACIQAGMNVEGALVHADTMARLPGKLSEKADKFPYLDQVLKALPAQSGTQKTA